MTVKELIEKLSKIENQDLQIGFDFEDECNLVERVNIEVRYNETLEPIDADDEERSYSDYCILS